MQTPVIRHMKKGSWGKTKAYFDVEIGAITIKGCRLVEGQNGLFASMPTKTQDAIKVTDEQKNKYQELLKHKCFKGKKKDTNSWWSKIYGQANPNESATKCLTQMEKAIELFENPEIEKRGK